MDDDDGRMTVAWLYYKLTHEPSAQVSVTMLKIIAVQITGLSNVGHDTGLAAVFGPKTYSKKPFMERFRFVFVDKITPLPL